MTMAELKTNVTKFSSEVVTVVPVISGDTPTVLASVDLGIDADRLTRLGVTGKAGETHRVLVSQPESGEAPVLLAGIGKERTDDSLRRAAGVAARALRKDEQVVYDLAEATEAELEALLTGHLLGGYTFDRFRGTGCKDAQVSQVLGAAGASQSLLDLSLIHI